MNIEVKKVKGHYEIYINGEFDCLCDINEFTETLREIEKENQWVYIIRISIGKIGLTKVQES